MSIRFIIEKFSSKLSRTEVKIADHILNNMEEIKEITSAELADRAGVGQSSVIKFIKKIGFEGFTDFKIKLSEELASKRSLQGGFLHSDISLEDSLFEATKKISYKHIESIEATTNYLSYSLLEEAVEDLNNANKIVILGMGASSLVGMDLQHKLTKIGKFSIHDPDPHVQVTQAVSAGRGDVILAISHSGETFILVETLSEVVHGGAKIISITGSERNSLADLAHINLPTVATDSFVRSSALSSRIAQLTVIDAIFMGVLKKNYSEGMKFIDKSSGIIKSLNRKK